MSSWIRDEQIWRIALEGRVTIRHWSSEGSVESGPYSGYELIIKMGKARIVQTQSGRVYFEVNGGAWLNVSEFLMAFMRAQRSKLERNSFNGFMWHETRVRNMLSDSSRIVA